MSTETVLSGTSVDGFGTFSMVQNKLHSSGHIHYVIACQLDRETDYSEVLKALVNLKGVTPGGTTIRRVSGTDTFEAMFIRRPRSTSDDDCDSSDREVMIALQALAIRLADLYKWSSISVTNQEIINPDLAAARG